jgi:hypothetical protein
LCAIGELNVGKNRCWYRYLIKTVVVIVNVFCFFYSNRTLIDLVAPATIATKNSNRCKADSNYRDFIGVRKRGA